MCWWYCLTRVGRWWSGIKWRLTCSCGKYAELSHPPPTLPLSRFYIISHESKSGNSADKWCQSEKWEKQRSDVGNVRKRKFYGVAIFAILNSEAFNIIDIYRLATMFMSSTVLLVDVQNPVRQLLVQCACLFYFMFLKCKHLYGRFILLWTLILRNERDFVQEGNNRFSVSDMFLNIIVLFWFVMCLAFLSCSVPINRILLLSKYQTSISFNKIINCVQYICWDFYIL